MNIRLHVSFLSRLLSYLSIRPGVGLLNHMVGLFLIFNVIFILFSIVTVPTYITTNEIVSL